MGTSASSLETAGESTLGADCEAAMPRSGLQKLGEVSVFAECPAGAFHSHCYSKCECVPRIETRKF